jgi:hypothetical protein
MRTAVFFLAVCSAVTIFRTHLTQWEWLDGDFTAVASQPSIPAHPLREADLNSDGKIERIEFIGGSVSIQGGLETLWSSPSDWKIEQAQISDLDHDGNPELTLLVWRPFAPWLIDAFLPHGGRIAGFHDAQNRSCHIILIHWARNTFRELWAGSALAEPLLDFYAADWNGDGHQELMAVETGYDQPSMARALSLWEWNGFGFSLIGRRTTRMGKIEFLTNQRGVPSILIDLFE